MSYYVVSVDLSHDEDKYCYTVTDTADNTVVYSGDDLQQLRKYNYNTLFIDEQDVDLLTAKPKLEEKL